MLCTKCGQEYEGSQCPRCDGPVILVNNSDYLARRKAYEQKAQIIETANEMSREISKGTKDYADNILEKVQTVLEDALKTVENNRKELK